MQRNLRQIPSVSLFHFLSFAIYTFSWVSGSLIFKIITIFKMNMNLKFSYILMGD